MPYGYSGKILRVNLSTGKIWAEETDELFRRRYVGGVGFISYYLLKEVPKGVDAFHPENRLIFAAGPVTGAPLMGASRNAVGAKSPLTDGYGKTEVGGWWGAELKRAGWDAVIIEGKAEKPVYLWIQDDKAELRDASHLWGKRTKETEEAVRSELGDNLIRTAAIGLGGEKLVRFASVINDLRHTAGRSGMGAVMGAKNLKLIAVRGTGNLELADPEKVRELNRWMAERFRELARGTHELGTGAAMDAGSFSGNLPTRNFRDGIFPTAEKLDARVIRDTIRIGMEGCYACPIRCKKMVQTGAPYFVDPTYGGPEYETLAAFGSNCGIDDLEAVCKAHELCNAHALDTISAGATVAFAMECFENGLLTLADTEGLELTFGNAQAMLAVLEKIVRREGVGDLLAEGTKRAAQEIGRGAEQFAMEVKGVELGMHEPRGKHALGLGYATVALGADHGAGLHDTGYTQEAGIAGVRELTILEPMRIDDLGPKKVRAYKYLREWRNFMDSLVACTFIPWNRSQTMEMVRAVTGWSFNMWEAMKLGERVENMARAFNVREGLTPADDRLPERFFSPPTAGFLKENNMAIGREAFERAKRNYYGMMGWDRETGIPTQDKLDELDISWVGEAMA